MIYALVAGIILGYLAAYHSTYEERKYLRDELRVAHAQIAHAVMVDHAQIPARYEPPEPPEPLPAELHDLVTQWEDPESRAIEEAKIRGWLAEGWGHPAIKRQYGVTT